jgi:hypothetical protein
VGSAAPSTTTAAPGGSERGEQRQIATTVGAAVGLAAVSSALVTSALVIS